VPERGESGPWCWMPTGPAEVISGAGLPANHHVSTFVVWQAVRYGSLTDNEADSGVSEPVVTEPVAPIEPGISVFNRRINRWANELGITVKNISQRLDQPTGDIVYIVKDIFTTRDGSWEPSDRVGSIEPWAREYLRPFGAPDYFDDAGGDRHLFAAVLGVDGQLIRQKEIIFWSDGFEQLGDSGYNEYVRRETKSGSGWINIPIGPGSSFVPERGESGPWCWAPTGAAQVVCGGGLPANQHVSFFVVWQAMQRGDLAGIEGEVPLAPPTEERTDDGLEHNTYFPIIGGARRRQPEKEPESRSPEVIAAQNLPDSGLEASELSHLLKIRAGGWDALQLEFQADGAFAQYARLHELGMPVTEQFEVENYLAQGFMSGIVYSQVGKSNELRHMAW